MKPTGVELIAAERQRQIEVEGWTPAHDDGHSRGQMADAAACYALTEDMREEHNDGGTPYIWPWDAEWWKPKDRIRDLVRAGALIAAEIDRLQRLSPPLKDCNPNSDCPNCDGSGEDETGAACQVCG